MYPHRSYSAGLSICSRQMLIRILFVAIPAFIVLISALPSWGQIVAHPNQINGILRFSNSNPEILEILNKPTDTPPGLDEGLKSANVKATSQPPQSPTLTHSTRVTADTRRGSSYEITVEGGPPGAGIEYSVGVTARFCGHNTRYEFIRQISPCSGQKAKCCFMLL